MTDVLLPGGRDVRGTLDEPENGTSEIVVACPPHPQQGGHRGDRRLLAVSDALLEADVACLRFDYGAWDDGRGEREDARNAIRWAADGRYDRAGVFGFSFGASLALLASASVDREVAAVSALAPTARVAAGLEVVPALESLAVPLQVVVGERDTTVDWEPVADAARERGGDVVGLSADHFFVGQHPKVARTVASFLVDAVGAE